jgi:hypothetical protein
MKIYFTASISRMDDKSRNNCQLILDKLEKEGHQVLSKHVLIKNYKTLETQTPEQSLKIQQKLTKFKKQADLIIAEVSNQSIGIGQEISLSLTFNKPVIALYEKGHKKPHILMDEGKDSLFVNEYTRDNLSEVLKDVIDYAADHQDTRFNFFVSPKHINYMDWISKTRRIPRSVFLRRLIEQAMDQDEEYMK